MLNWLIKLANGECFVVLAQPDEEEAWAAAVQVRDDQFYERDGAAAIVSVEVEGNYA